MNIIDDYSRYVWTYTIALKSDAMKTFVGFENLYARGRIGAIRTDKILLQGVQRLPGSNRHPC